MRHPNLTDRAVAAHVKTTMALDDASGRVAAAAQRRARTLRDDGDRGSQTAEYAMVGGVGAAAAGALIACVTKPEIWQPVLKAIFDALRRAVRSWF